MLSQHFLTLAIWLRGRKSECIIYVLIIKRITKNSWSSDLYKGDKIKGVNLLCVINRMTYVMNLDIIFNLV